jgi:hypothetical protein
MADDPISEEWRVVSGFPDYEVSDRGRVRRITDAFWGRWRTKTLRTPAGFFLKAYPINGYPVVALFKNGKRYNKGIHILICTAFHGEKPTPNHEVAHWDGDRTNFSINNLRWVTAKENCEDGIRLGRTQRGEKSYRAKLNANNILEIRRLLGSGQRLVSIANEYGVTPECIASIRDGKSWGWLA